MKKVLPVIISIFNLCIVMLLGMLTHTGDTWYPIGLDILESSPNPDFLLPFYFIAGFYKNYQGPIVVCAFISYLILLCDIAKKIYDTHYK